MKKKSTVNSQQPIIKTSCVCIKLCKLICLLIAYNLSLITASAQSVSASLDRDKILLGEQVTLQLNLTEVNPLIYFVASGPQVSDTLNHIEVIKRTNIDTIEVNGTNSFQQNFIITGFDSGRWQLGPFNFILQEKNSGKQKTVASPAVYLTVLPVDVSALKTYHPLKDIIEVQTSFNWWPVITAAVVLIAAIIIFIVIKKRKKTPLIAKPVLIGTPIQRAIEKLQKLHKQSLNNNDEIKKFHSDIDIICRTYFEETTSVQAMQATTSEIFSRMNIFIPDADLRRKMLAIFELNASVKFAKYMPVKVQSKSILEQVIANLEQTDILKHQANTNAHNVA